MGDVGRLEFILECLTKQKPLYNTDEKYLTQKYQEFETKLEILSEGKKKKSKLTVTENHLDEIVDEALAKEKSIQNTIILSISKEKSFFKRLFGRK